VGELTVDLRFRELTDFECEHSELVHVDSVRSRQLPQVCREAVHGPACQEAGDGKAHLEQVADLRHRLRGEQRMTAQLEEVVFGKPFYRALLGGPPQGAV
jgi:hypothetical protein